MKKFFSLFVAALFCATMFATTYTVAGSSVDLLGSSWSASDENNDMTLVSGTTYQLVKTNKQLPAGDIQYKVAEDHKWDVSHPSSNATLNIPSAGIYTVTFTFDSNSNEVSANAEKTGDAVVVPSFTVKGSWDWDTPISGEIAGNNESASCTKTFASAATYEFGIELGGSWKSNGSTQIFSRDANSAEITGYSGNMKLAVDAAGEYTFTWTYATNTLTVTFPAADPEARPTVEMKGSWDSWAAGVEFELAGNKETASVTKALEAGDYQFKMIIGGDWKSKDWNINREYHTVAAITENPSQNININADVTGDYVFTWTFETNTLDVTYPVATAISNTAVEGKAVKSIENGMLIIRRDGKSYNVLGTVIK